MNLLRNFLNKGRVYMLKETFKMRKIGKHLVNVSMLSLAIAPVVGSALAPVTVFAAEYKSGQDGSNKLEFITKSSTSSTSTTAHEPMDLIQIIDLSGSLSEGEFKSRIGYSGARRQQLMDMIYVIQNKLTDQDHVMLAFYGTNNQNSYETNGQDGSAATKLLSKSEALDILKRLVNTNEVMEMSQSWTLIPNIVVPMLGDKVIRTTEHKGFEQVYEEQPNRNKVVSALQFTDDWVADETIDSSFAEWAKKNAKTFMTVVDGVGGSVEKMKAAGHPNIMTYGLTDYNKAGRSEEIAKHFESTATVTKTTTTKQKAHVSITPEAGVTLKTAELVDSTGKKTPLTIKDNKVSADLNDLADGKYVVNYTFGGSVDSAKKIVSSVSVDGKEVDKKEDTINPAPTIVKEPAKPEITKRTEEIPFKTETKEDPTLPEGEKKVIQKGEKGLREFVTTTTPAQGTGKFELTKESTAVKNADGTYTQKIQVVSDPKKTVVEKPTDLLLIMDGSGSLLGKNTKNGPRVLETAMRDALALINSLPEGSQVSIMSYAENNSDSYRTPYYTKLLSKADAISMLNDLIKLTPQATYDWYRVWEPYAKAHADKFLPAKEMQYEDAYQAQEHKLDNVSVIQFTDGWAYKTYNNGGYLTEDIDQSFAKWAKDHAKTFMSVVYPTLEDKERQTTNKFTEPWSIMQMKKAGHPNAYNADGVPDGKREQDIINAFKHSAIETQEVSGRFTIDGTKGVVQLIDVKLMDPNGKDVPVKNDGKINPYNFNIAGTYTLIYSFKPQKAGDIKGVFTIGANSLSKTDAFVELEGKPVTNETNKVIKEPVNEIIAIGTKGSKSDVTEKKVPFETIRKDDPTLEEGQEKVVQEGVEGVIKVTTTYETQKGEKVKGSEKVTETEAVKKVDKIIAVGTKGSKFEVTEKKVPFETIYKQDPTLKKGEEKVLQEGVEGVTKVTTTYETQKGKKVDGSEKVTEETVTEKVDKIVAQGSMEKRKVRYRVVDSKGQELVKQTDVTEAYQDEEYKVETPKLDGYRLELAKDSVPATGKVADRDVLVTFVAVKIGKPVTLKFVDESGSEIAQKKVLTGENVDVDTEFSGEAPETIEKDGVKYAFVGIKQTGSKERKVSGKVTDQEQVIEAVYAKPKELPKTSEQAKQRNTAIVALLSVVGLGGLVTYLGLRRRDEK